MDAGDLRVLEVVARLGVMNKAPAELKDSAVEHHYPYPAIGGQGRCAALFRRHT